MKDALNNEIHIGDRVAFISTYSNNSFSHIDEGIVEKICDYMIWIKDTKHQYYQQNFHRNRYAIRSFKLDNRTLRCPSRVVKL